MKSDADINHGEAFSRLPSMTALLDAAGRDARFSGVARGPLTNALRLALDRARALLRGTAPNTDVPHSTGDAARSAAARPADDAASSHDVASIESLLSSAAADLAAQRRAQLGRVINATGIVLHTGLGRAPLPAAAIEAVTAAAGYCNLELDMETGERGRRAAQCEAMLCRLTGAEAALVVNNNAAATLLVLAGLAFGREVIVSRGQLIEIGGSFRLPDVMACSGCRMREVGTTNKTRLADYEKAIGVQTALLLHVHPSNYRIEGFAESPDTAALVGLARPRGLVVYDDLGSGALFDDALWQAAAEPTVSASLTAGADVVSFSGDKLLGGPQAGLILGRRKLIERLRSHPLARALRVDKLTIAALQATLALYDDPPRALREIPTLRMLHEPIEVLRERAGRLANKLRRALAGAKPQGPAATVEVRDAQSFAGGGALPAWPLPTAVVAMTPAPSASAVEWSRALRQSTPPVVARIENDALIFDMRTLGDSEVSAVVAACAQLVGGGGNILA